MDLAVCEPDLHLAVVNWEWFLKWKALRILDLALMTCVVFGK